MMVNAGITRLVYKEPYRDTKGLDLLREAGIIVETFKGD
jgi:deoxycytidylate deaminase